MERLLTPPRCIRLTRHHLFCRSQYAVGFKLAFKSANSPLKELLTITPSEGSIAPGQKAAVKVHFNKDKALKREVNIQGNADLVLSIIETLNNSVENKIPIRVDLKAVFTKYNVTPARGLSFGPVTYKTQSKPRVFEVANLGEFPFVFRVFDMANPPEPGSLGTAVTAASDPKAKAAAKPPAGKAAPGAPFTIGPFLLEPGTATVEPGETLQVKVLFNADGDQAFHETVGLHISERDFADNPDGIRYELTGDSCIPGINTTDVDTIFEEHRVLNQMDPFAPASLVFYKRERLFDFGPVVAQLAAPPAEGAAADPKAKPDPKAKGGAAPAAAAVAHEPEGDEEAKQGVSANLRISNPAKVPCTVSFNVQSKGSDPTFPMWVHPAKLDIPPHEYRYITVRFAPTAIQSYVANFEAKVENGGDPKTSGFSFEVRGEGVLPHVTLVEPSVRAANGHPLLKFPRLLLGREHTLPVLLRNDGSLPASYRLDFPTHASFHIHGGPSALTLEPRQSQQYMVSYRPQRPGSEEHSFHILVKQNSFERITVDLSGEGYNEDVIFEGLTHEGSDADVLSFPDTAVGGSARLAFDLRNGSGKAFRFKWGNLPLPHLVLSPAVGHLLPGATKMIIATFTPEAKCRVKAAPLPLQLEEIQFPEPELEPEDWDDRATIADFSQGPDAPAVPKPEPAHTVVPQSARVLNAKCSAGADLSRYQCDMAPIVFKPTMMFQTRVFAFPVKNLGEARLPFRFSVLLADGSRMLDGSGYYSVEPAAGEIEPGQELEVTVRFSPTEVEDCTRILACEIPHLAEGQKPLERTLTGRVQRPWCHMELQESDYLSSGRRNPDMRGPTGGLGPLDPATKVIEFDSLGFRIRNTRRFFVLNPTNIQYEFVWEHLPVPGDDRPSPFRCQTARGTIGGGKRFEMVLDYTPEEDQLREDHWVFRIPEQGISVPFLLVGHVKEPHVVLSTSSLGFGLVQVGAKRQETIQLTNEEDVPFAFHLDKESYEATEQRIASTGRKPVLEFEPSSGTVGPKSSLSIVVTYTPVEERPINFNVVCHVRKKPSALTLNVKGEGFLIHESVQVATADGKAIELAPRADNTVDLGRVLINERLVKQVSIINSGNVNLEFNWACGENPRVSVRPEAGKVRKGERFVCELAYHPHKPERLEDYLITCQIVNGPKYRLRLRGEGHKPRLNLSWYSHDFGPCFVHEPGMAPNTAVLRARNDDKAEISFDCLFEETPHLKVQCSAVVLQPGESRDIPVLFTPTREGKFEETVPLEINGLYTVNLLVKGEGAPMRFEVLRGTGEPSTSALGTLPTIALGSTRPGQSASKVVRIANRSKVRCGGRDNRP